MYPFDPGIIHSFSLKRLFNVCMNTAEYLFSLIFKKPFFWSYPYILTIEPTSLCNLSCPLCPSGTKSLKRKGGNISNKLYDNILDNIGEYTVYLMLYFQGEPFLHKGIFDLIKKARSKKIYTLTSTNGHFIGSRGEAEKIISSGLDALVVSLDGFTQEVYEKYRTGGNLEKVINGLKILRDTKKEKGSGTPKLFIQFLIMEHNKHQTDDIKKLAEELKADRLSFKSIQADLDGTGVGFLPDAPEFNRYVPEKKGLKIKGKMKNRCFKLFSTAVITWNGNVVPCCFDKDDRYILGNISEDNSLKNIWFSDNMKRFKKRLLKNRKSIDICNNCTEGIS